MAILIRYLAATGQIQGAYSANTEDLLAAQASEDPVYSFVLSDNDAVWLAQEQYAIVNGEVTAKTPATITTSRNPFPPDNVAECDVSLNPFVPCTLRVNGTPYVLTQGDQSLTLTSDVQASFTVSLDWLATHWADPITVEAQGWIPVGVTDSVTGADALSDSWTNVLHALAQEVVALGELLPMPWTSILSLTADDSLASADSLVQPHAILAPIVSSAVALEETLALTGTTLTSAVSESVQVTSVLAGMVRTPILLTATETLSILGTVQDRTLSTHAVSSDTVAVSDSQTTVNLVLKRRRNELVWVSDGPVTLQLSMLPLTRTDALTLSETGVRVHLRLALPALSDTVSVGEAVAFLLEPWLYVTGEDGLTLAETISHSVEETFMPEPEDALALAEALTIKETINVG